MSVKHSWLNKCFVFCCFAVITASFLIGLILFLVLALPLTNPSWYHSVYYQEQLQDGWWRTSRKGITTNTLRQSKLNSRWSNRLLVRKKFKVCFRPHLLLNSIWGSFGMCNKNFFSFSKLFMPKLYSMPMNENQSRIFYLLVRFSKFLWMQL